MNKNMYDILINEYGLTPDEVDELMRAGVMAGEQQTVIPRQQTMAEELRSARAPQGRYVGGTYRAAHPLEHIGHLAERGAGVWMEEAARRRQMEMLREQARLRGTYLRGMGGRPAVPGVAGTAGPAPAPTWTMNQMYR